jgi:hypothetical protein
MDRLPVDRLLEMTLHPDVAALELEYRQSALRIDEEGDASDSFDRR